MPRTRKTLIIVLSAALLAGTTWFMAREEGEEEDKDAGIDKEMSMWW